MIIRSSTHNAAIKSLQDKHEAEKEELRQLYFAHLQTLEARVEDLKALVFSPTSSSNIPIVQLEADAVFNQRDEVLEIDKEEMEKQDFVLRERDRIFSGSYDEDMA